MKGAPADIYFLGLQEGVSDSIFHSLEGLTSILASCERVPLSDPHHQHQHARQTPPSEASKYSNADGPLSSSPSLVSTSPPDHSRDRDRISGRGDGSLVGTKFTGSALFCKSSLLQSGAVRLLSCVAHPLEKFGSKGGVAVAINVRGSTVVFVTCHLEASKRDVRRQQYRELVVGLGEKLGIAKLDLQSQFHHIIWTGDLNYRCVERSGEPMASERALAFLQRGNNFELFSEHDQLTQERQAQEVFGTQIGWTEPTPHPCFFPTYKKREKREKTDYSDPEWARTVYRTRYKEPIYKGGNVKERTPG